MPLAAKDRPRPMRVQLLDYLRGFSLVSMILYHGVFDVVYLFGKDLPWYEGRPGYLWQQSICWVFILVSGASLHYGRNTYKRGLKVLGGALLLSLVTWIVMPSQTVMFGILHCIGLSMLLAKALGPLLKKIKGPVGFVLTFLLFAATKQVPYRYLGFLDLQWFRLSDKLYTSQWGFWLGFPRFDFSSGDYFPLIPWFFLFLCGYFGWGMVKGKMKVTPSRKSPLAFMGRHSLIIYLAHQPILYGMFWLLHRMGVL